jgi:hypothetical protein
VHHPKFKVDESALPIGAALHVAMALEALAALEPIGNASLLLKESRHDA